MANGGLHPKCCKSYVSVRLLPRIRGLCLSLSHTNTHTHTHTHSPPPPPPSLSLSLSTENFHSHALQTQFTNMFHTTLPLQHTLYSTIYTMLVDIIHPYMNILHLMATLLQFTLSITNPLVRITAQNGLIFTEIFASNCLSQALKWLSITFGCDTASKTAQWKEREAKYLLWKFFVSLGRTLYCYYVGLCI